MKALHGLSMYHPHLLKKPIKSMVNNTANKVINFARKKRARRTLLTSGQLSQRYVIKMISKYGIGYRT